MADPDGLLLEEGVIEGIRRRGFELIPFEDPVAFRYAYESRFRSRWDRGEDTDLVVVRRSPASDLGGLPHDLLRAGRRLSFHLGDIFPSSVSRQATFAGKAPLFFPGSIHTTEKEPTLWAQFWGDQGLTPQEVVYRKVLKDEDLEKVADDLSHPKAKVVGLTVDKVDKIMHGMALGTSGMHNQVGQWARQPYVGALLDLLLERGFLVYLTSDHGNIEAEGCGRPSEGAVADLRGERVRIYPDGALREGVHKRFPDAMAWDPVGLPEKYFPLLAPPRRAFVREGERIVSHGGISVEELIVPFIRIDMPGGSAQAERRVP